MKTKTTKVCGINNCSIVKHKMNKKTNKQINYSCFKNILNCQETNIVLNHSYNFYTHGFYKDYDDC